MTRTYRIAAFTLFLGSALTFWLQPMVGRLLLPRYGGSASVWVVCLAAFQALLLAGYGYAYGLSKLPPRVQRLAHLALLAGVTAWVFLGGGGAPAAGATPEGGGVALRVLGDVLRLAAAPFILVAAGSTLLQAWVVMPAAGAPGTPATMPGRGNKRGALITAAGHIWPALGKMAESGAQAPASGAQAPAGGERPAATGSGASVYRLYAWGNLGSFCGLFLYPLGLEPFVSVGAQRVAWAAVLALYAAAVAWVAWEAGPRRASVAGRGVPAAPPSDPASTIHHSPSTTHHSLLHFLLPCLSSALLVAVTAHVTQQVIALPLVWALLLGAFLLSYVAGFSEAAVRQHTGWRLATLVFLAAAPLFFVRHSSFWIGVGVLAYGTAFIFVTGVWLHGWLYASRPSAAGLPRFYFLLALGGAVGGALASLAAPALFPAVWEMPIMLALVAALAGGHKREPLPRMAGAGVRREGGGVLVYAALAGVVVCLWRGFVPNAGIIHRARDFYGAISVIEVPVRMETGEVSPMRQLVHGTVNHGQQFFRPGWERRPLSYFGPYSGAALAVEGHPKRRSEAPMRVGIVGLGIGSLVAYGMPGDRYVCYEISRPVIEVATNRAWFTYLDDALAEVELKLGDGRALLAEERRTGAPPFDVLYLDAFSGDSPPLHLLTREAFALYLERLAPDGVIAMNITNWHLNFQPLCKAAAREFGLDIQGFFTPNYPERMQAACVWVILSREAREYRPHAAVRRIDWERVRDLPLPTDGRGSALRYLGTSAGMVKSLM